jgi:LAS superfamily LD-carboxypeptidase LdcB
VEVNGRLTVATLTRIHHPRGIPVFLRRDAAAAWEAMRSTSMAQRGVDLYPLGGASAYRTFEQQVELKQMWTARGKPGNAATPGTSNHGWGLAVDAGSGSPGVDQTMWKALREIGPNFGWSWDEGQRVGEPWHFRYVGGFKADPLAFMTEREARLVRELLALQRIPNPTARQIQRRKAVWRWLRDQRKRIWRRAQESGWQTAHRRQRYEVLRHVTRT